jgi:hypothetical protein
VFQFSFCFIAAIIYSVQSFDIAKKWYLIVDESLDSSLGASNEAWFDEQAMHSTSLSGVFAMVGIVRTLYNSISLISFLLFL